jgi:hypothetical protein
VAALALGPEPGPNIPKNSSLEARAIRQNPNRAILIGPVAGEDVTVRFSGFRANAAAIATA